MIKYMTIEDTLEHIAIYCNSCNGKIVTIRETRTGVYQALLEVYEESDK